MIESGEITLTGICIGLDCLWWQPAGLGEAFLLVWHNPTDRYWRYSWFKSRIGL